MTSLPPLPNRELLADLCLEVAARPVWLDWRVADGSLPWLRPAGGSRSAWPKTGFTLSRAARPWTSFFDTRRALAGGLYLSS